MDYETFKRDWISRHAMVHVIHPGMMIHREKQEDEMFIAYLFHQMRAAKKEGDSKRSFEWHSIIVGYHAALLQKQEFERAEAVALQIINAASDDDGAGRKE